MYQYRGFEVALVATAGNWVGVVRDLQGSGARFEVSPLNARDKKFRDRGYAKNAVEAYIRAWGGHHRDEARKGNINILRYDGRKKQPEVQGAA